MQTKIRLDLVTRFSLVVIITDSVRFDVRNGSVEIPLENSHPSNSPSKIPSRKFPSSQNSHREHSNPFHYLSSLNTSSINVISIMKAIICKYRVLLGCESTSYELRAKEYIVKCACGQEEVAQSGNVSRRFGRHADR